MGSPNLNIMQYINTAEIGITTKNKSDIICLSFTKLKIKMVVNIAIIKPKTIHCLLFQLIFFIQLMHPLSLFRWCFTFNTTWPLSTSVICNKFFLLIFFSVIFFSSIATARGVGALLVSLLLVAMVLKGGKQAKQRFQLVQYNKRFVVKLNVCSLLYTQYADFNLLMR